MVKQVNNKEYKQTQIGNIPEDWTLKPLEQLCIKDGLVRGPFGGSLKKEFFIEKGIKVYEQKNAIYKNTETGSYFIDNQKYVEMKRFEVFPKDFIVSCSGTIGKIFQIPENAPRGIINQALLKIRTDKSQIFDQYFFHYFNWDVFQARIIESTQGGAMKNLVGMDIFRKTMIALPPNEKEQCSIARVLSDVDYLIEALGSLIEKKKCIKQGAMQELLTGKKRLPGFSGEWEFKTLGNIAEIFDGTHQTPRYVTEGIPFYSVENVTNDDFINTKFISNKAHQILNKIARIEKKDILMTRIGSIGDCKLIDWDVKASFYVSLALLKIRKDFSPDYIYQYSNSYAFKREAEINSLQWATPKKINLGEISKIRIHIPHLKDEQIAIAEFLTDMASEIKALERKREKCKLLKIGLMQQLLTGRIRLKCPS